MKTATHKSLKLFAFVMSVLVLIVSLPMYAFADLVDTSSTETSVTETAENKSEVFVVCEEEDLREENIKHFKLSDGTTKAVVYTQPVHYKDSEGKFVDIDNALTLSGNEHSAKNKLEIKFANKSGSSGLVSIKDGEYKIDFTPQNADKVSVEIENPQKTNSRKFDDLKVLTNLTSRATYKGIYDGIDLEYILVGNNIKENIIVNKAQKSYTYSFEIKLNKLVAELRDGAVILSDYDSGEQVYKIPAPYMLDANGAYSQAVEYTLTQQSKWKYTLTVTADPAWINAEDRAFPVTVDPTVVLGTNDETGTINAYEYDSTPEDNVENQMFVYDTTALLVGNYMGVTDSIAYVRIHDQVPGIPTGTILVSAKISMGIQGCEESINVGVHKAIADWTNGATLTDRNGYISNEMSSYVTLNSSPYQVWDITLIYREWLADSDSYYGVGFKRETIVGQESAGEWAFLAAVAHPDRVYPTYELCYANLQGVEEYYGMQENTLGDYGKSYVNLYNGGLTYVNKLTTITNGSMSYDINMVYDSIEKKWMGSFEESITPYEADNFIRYKWIDGDGTTHWFSPYMEKIYWGEYSYYNVDAEGQKTQTQTPTEFYPEDDIDYVLTKTESGELILKDYNGNQKFFDYQGKLTKFCNTAGDVLYFYYIKQHNNQNVKPRLSCIVLKNTSGTISDQVRFDYNAQHNNLCYVYNVQTEEEVVIDWLTNLRIESVSYNYENQDVFNIVEYAYFSSSKALARVEDSNGQKSIEYERNSVDSKYYTIKELSSEIEHKRYSLQYNSNQAVVIDNGTDFISDNDNVTVSTSSFDTRGRKSNVSVGEAQENFTYDDSILPESVYFSVEYSENIYLEPYNTVDEAAMAFAVMYYSSSYYIRHEYGALIYACAYTQDNEGNSVSITTYNFTNIVYGGPHSVNVNPDDWNAYNFVADVHTHPQGMEFSSNDKNSNDDTDTHGYLAIPGCKLIKYDYIEKTITDGVPFTPVVLTAKRKQFLLERFASSWQSHISTDCSNGFECNLQPDGFWPNEG